MSQSEEANKQKGQATHLSHHKEFGRRPSITVYVRDKRDNLSDVSQVLINWSCVGSVSIIEADDFRANLVDALEYARRYRNRLWKKSPVPKGAKRNMSIAAA